MKPRLLIPNSQRVLHNKAGSFEQFIGSYASAHTGLGQDDILIDCGPQADDRQTLVVWHGSHAGGSNTAMPIVTLGGQYAIQSYKDRPNLWWSNFDKSVTFCVFDTSKLPGRMHTLSTQPTISAVGHVLGVYSLSGYHHGAVRANGTHTASTADLFKVVAGDIVIAGLTVTSGAVTWTAGTTDEDYDLDSGSTVQGSAAHNFNPTPAQPYTISWTETSAVQPMYAVSFRRKTGKNDLMLYLLRPTGAHGATGLEDASWRGRSPPVLGPTNEYTGRYYSGGPGAVDFAGVGLPDIPSQVHPSRSDRSGWCVEWWEYPHVLNAGARCGGIAGFEFIAGYTAGALSFYMSSNGGSWDMSSNRSMGTDAANVWTHRAITWKGKDSGDWMIFENGAVIDSWNTGSLTPYTGFGGSMRVGGASGSTSFNGLMEDFAVWRYPKYTNAFAVPTVPIIP